MQKKFLSNLILLLALNFLVKPFYLLGIETEVQNRVGAEVFGDFFALISFSFLLNIILDLGINNFNTRELARDPEKVRSTFSKIFVIRLILFLIYVIVVMIVGSVLNYSSDQMNMLALLAFNQGLAALILFLRSNLTGLHLFKSDSLISVLDRLLLIIILGFLLWSGYVTCHAFKIEWFIYAQTVTYGFTMLLALFMVLRKAGKLRFSFDWNETKALLIKSAPFALLIFLMLLAFRLDTVMLERMLPDIGKLEAGIYAMGFRYFEAANMIAYLFAVLLLPLFARMLKNKEKVTDLVYMSGRILLAGSLILALLCYNFDLELMQWRYINNTEMAAPIFGILMFTFIAISLSYVFGTLMTANGNLKVLNVIALAGFLLNLVLNILWIPKYQAFGCAMATLIAQSLMTLAQIIWAHRNMQLDYKWSSLIRIAVFIAGCLIFSQFTTIFFEKWLYNAGMFVGLCLIWAFLTRMLDLKNFLKLVRE